MSEVVDEKYYQVVPEGSLAKRVLIRARDRIYDDFVATMQPKPTDKILDVGVSDVVSDDANAVERKYPYPKRNHRLRTWRRRRVQSELPENWLP